MGYCAYSHETTLRVYDKNIIPMAIAVNEYNEKHGYCYYTEEIKTVMDALFSLEDTLSYYGMETYDNSEPYYIDYNGEKFHSDDVIECLTVIAPYVEDMSHIGFIGESGDIWAYRINNGSVQECRGRIVYDENDWCDVLK